MHMQLEFFLTKESVHLRLMWERDAWLICSTSGNPGWCTKCTLADADCPGRKKQSEIETIRGFLDVSNDLKVKQKIISEKIQSYLKPYPEKPIEEVYIDIMDYLSRA